MTTADSGVKPVFACGPDLMIRSPARPWATVGIAPEPAASDTDPFPAVALAEFLRRLAEPGLDESLALSSPALAGTLDAIRAGKPVRNAALRRAALAAARYQLRGASRATPFGLLSGVAVVRLGERTDIRVGAAHRRAVGPDAEWLTAVLAGWERRPEVLDALCVVANNLVTVRGGRVVLPFVADAAFSDTALPDTALPDTGARERGAGVRERSVRHTPVVRAVLRLARRPIRYPELRAAVLNEFPTAPAAKVGTLLGQLVEAGLLLTELRPSVHEADPLGRALAILGPRAAELPGPIGAELAELAAIQAGLAEYADTPIGAGRPALTALTGRMTALRPAQNLLAVTLGLDITGTVHHAVGAELARAATLLWRLNPDTTPEWLRTYHGAFLERYGTDRLVPVLELLDTERGLGAPANYREPPGQAKPGRDPDFDRDEILAALAMGAGPGGEAVLDDAILTRLCPEDPDALPQSSMDLCAELVATGPAAVDRGDFLIVLLPWAGSLTAGAMFARFARPIGRADLLARRIPGDDAEGGALPVSVAAHPRAPRSLNVMDRGLPREDYIAVGAFHDPGHPGAVPLDDLMVGADGDRLRILSRDRRRVLRFATYHMLTPRLAPDVARLLNDVSLMGQRRLRPWDWGALAVAPFLPRVRCGRIVLAPARWRLTDPVLTDRGTSWRDWRHRLAAWRDRWQVPAAVRLGAGDHHIRLDLDRAWHQWLLRDHLLAEGRAQLREDTTHLGPVGWLTGPQPPAAAEIVVSLHAIPARRERIGPRPTAALMATASHRPHRHLPGGSWLYAKLYLGAERHDEFIVGPLADLVTRLSCGTDRWFLVRYADPEPHLRLRVHGDPAVLTGKILADLHDWAAELMSSGQLRDLQLAGYEPETHRYGGPGALTAAETVFHADSLAVIAQLGGRATEPTTVPATEPFLLPAANMADIARHLLSGVPGGNVTDWVLAHITKSEDDHRAFREHRAAALRLIGEDTLDLSRPEDTPPPGLPMPAGTWRHRAAALREYGAVLHFLQTGQQRDDLVNTALAALMHMHHNRLIGADRGNEHRAQAVLRGAVAAHDARRRAVRR